MTETLSWFRSHLLWFPNRQRVSAEWKAQFKYFQSSTSPLCFVWCSYASLSAFDIRECTINEVVHFQRFSSNGLLRFRQNDGQTRVACPSFRPYTLQIVRKDTCERKLRETTAQCFFRYTHSYASTTNYLAIEPCSPIISWTRQTKPEFMLHHNMFCRDDWRSIKWRGVV